MPCLTNVESNCGWQFVDYRKHSFLPEYLASEYGAQPFDTILDCCGSQSLFESSPNYVRPNGLVVNIGALEAGTARTIFRWFMNTWRPTWLGGVPRKYIMFSQPPHLPGIQPLIDMVAQGLVKINLDSEWPMEDLMKAYERVTSKRAKGKVLIRVHGE